MNGLQLFNELIPGIFERRFGFPSFFRDKSKFDDVPLEDLCHQLCEGSGDYSGLLIAEKIFDKYQSLDDAGKLSFFHFLNNVFDINADEVLNAAKAFKKQNNYANFSELCTKAEPRRQTLLRRLNQTEGGTFRLVKMREDLFVAMKSDAELKKVDDDFAHLFASWFNRGFLVMRPLDWSTPANILEKIIAYESVHKIQSWKELRQRLEPEDRKCYAFFHPAMQDEPLIFVEVALMKNIAAEISAILENNQTPVRQEEASTAVFYSISNCHKGLKGISFGNFLIKQVAGHLQQSSEQLQQFATLSPVPGFVRWLKSENKNPLDDAYFNNAIDGELTAENLRQAIEENKEKIMSLAAEYLLQAKSKSVRSKRIDMQHLAPEKSAGKKADNDKTDKAKTADNGEICFPADPVSRFHLGNGAYLKRINWMADTSDKGLKESLGLMVNYVYDLKNVEHNHERYTCQGEVIADDSIKHLIRKSK